MRSPFDLALCCGSAFLLSLASVSPAAAGDVEGGDYGDAPEGVLAYPSGILGEFPTCVLVGPSGYIFHSALGLSFLGGFVDVEGDGNANACPPGPYDNDECAGIPGADAGLLLPAALTLAPGGGSVLVCPGGPGAPSWTGCFTARWGVDVDILVSNFTPDDHYLNVLVDWDGNGRWDNTVQTCPQGNTAEEHVLRDWVVPAGFSGPASVLFPPDFVIGVPVGNLCWARFSLTDVPVGPLPWDGSGNFGDGETEDYLFRVADPPVDAPELGAAGLGEAGPLRVEAVQPNPALADVTIRFATDRIGRVELVVYDAAGRRVARIADAVLAAGTHVATWTGRDDAERAVTPGVYFVRARLEDEAVTAKVVVVR